MSQDDYDLTEHDRVMSRELGARFARGRKRLDAWLTQASERIAAAHQIEVGAQRRLLNRLLDVKAEIVSAANLEPDNWQISRDLTPWKEARAKLIALAKGLGSATEILKADDPVVLDALLKASRELPHRELPDLVGAVLEFEQIATWAASIEGKSGNRPHPPWMREATRRCEEFWREQMNEEPAAYFNAVKKPKKGERVRNRTTEPGNAFSCWFCDVMREVGGLTPSQCDTLLRRQ